MRTAGCLKDAMTDTFPSSWLTRKNVTAPDAPYKDYKNKLTYIRYKALPTYVLVNKNDKELARQINQALGELKKEGKIAELEKQYFGEEISPLLDQK